MPSTVIRRFDYRPETRELEILFTTGRRYLYANVPKQDVDDFRAAFSKGVLSIATFATAIPAASSIPFLNPEVTEIGEKLRLSLTPTKGF